MTKTLEKRIFLVIASITTILLLSGSSFFVLAQPSGSDWNGVAGAYPFNLDYSPQTAISASNVQYLQAKWLFPVPAPPTQFVTNPTQGIVFTPLVVGGIIYTLTGYTLLLALNARDGSVLWQRQLSLKFTFPGNHDTHYHAIYYTSTVRGLPLVWVVSGNGTIYGFNAVTGDLNTKFNFGTGDPAFRRTFPGNFGYYKDTSSNAVFDDKRGIVVVGSEGSEGVDAGRGYLEAFDLTSTPPKLLWQSFIIPPQDGSDPSWAIKSVNSMQHAWIFSNKTGSALDLKSMSASQLNTTLYGDWGTFGFNGTHSFAGNNPAWGGPWTVDPSTGIAYVATAQPSPDWNATYRPGPNLWSDSIIALDSTTGKFVWAFQTTPHDLFDYDCAWSILLANITVSGQPQKAVIKGCKNGVVYALNANTGALLWYNIPKSIRFSAVVRFGDPTSKQDMTKPWGNYPDKGPYIQNPIATGALEMNPSFDPTTNTVTVAVYNAPRVFQAQSVKGKNVTYFGNSGNKRTPDIGPTVPTNSANTTVWGIDASTGKAKWSFPIKNVGFRGGVAATNGLIFVPSVDGNIYVLNGQTGSLVYTKYIGALMNTAPAIAADTNGNILVIIPASGQAVGAGYVGRGPAPGFVTALGLSVPPILTATLTVAVTQTVAGPATGIDPATFYGAVVVAVIFVIATGVLAVRRRRPAP